MNNKKLNLISILVTIVVALITFYIFIPAINLHSFGFWLYVLFIVFVFTSMTSLSSIGTRGAIGKIAKTTIGGGIVFVVIIAGIMIVDFISSPLFNSRSYATRISINEENSFTENVSEVDFSKIPLLDKDSSQKLGDRVMGQMPEMVSQFYVSDIYTQINYNNEIVRVTPLEYDGFFKYLNNRKNGVSGYITVNSVTGEAKLTKLEKGMKYMPSAILNEDLHRKLRFSYPFDIFGEETFELDNEGHPYWIVPVIKYSAVGLKRDIKAVVILDPITGESKKYNVNEVPTWVDHVYSADVIIEQVDDWGGYRSGFFNSIFGQKNVVATTEGYNYTVMNDDVYLYTGITSLASDESNIGFILTNMRTKETNYYSVPGAEEYSAMSSAEGQVQQMNYNATFPLLINLNGKPTYLISLKDNAGLVKMYAFVDVVDYQKVVVTDASSGIEKAAENYLGDDERTDSSSYISKEIIIDSVKDVTIDGTTYFYIVDQEGKKYRVSIKVNKDILGFIKSGSKLKVSYKQESSIIDILKAE